MLMRCVPDGISGTPLFMLNFDVNDELNTIRVVKKLNFPIFMVILWSYFRFYVINCIGLGL